MTLTIEHIKEYTNYCFETGRFIDFKSVKAYDFKEVDGIINIALEMNPNVGTVSVTQYNLFSPEKMDVVIFIKTVLRQENLDLLLDGH